MFGRYTGFPWNPSGSWAVCSIYGALRQDCLARNVCHVGVVISRWHHVTYLGKQRESVLGAWLLLGRRLCLRIDACGLCDQVFVTGDLSYCNSVLSSIRWEFIFSCRVVSLWNWRRYREWCSASLVLVSSGDQLLPSVRVAWVGVVPLVLVSRVDRKWPAIASGVACWRSFVVHIEAMYLHSCNCCHSVFEELTLR